MATMQALVCTGPGAVSWRELPRPVVSSPHDAIVRPLVVATCDIDGQMIAGATPYRAPIALGHECIAEVVEVGEAVTRVTPGQRVVVPFQISCGACAACRRGHTGNCTAGAPMAMFGFGKAGGHGGALADALRVPFADAMLVDFPSSRDPTHFASLADNLPDAYRAVRPVLDTPGAEVLIVGGGCTSIGLYAIDVARALGAAAVTYLDPDPERCARAEQLGAEVACTPYPGRAARRYPVVVDASADPAGLACAVRSTAADGVCTSTGGYFTDTTPVPLRDLYLSVGTLVTGRCHARPAIEPLLALASSLAPARVTAAVVPWSAAAAVLSAPLPGKLVITRGDADARP
jgi:threonine dehydrogenase-like Zn-dependent dehydrogenase